MWVRQGRLLRVSFVFLCFKVPRVGRVVGEEASSAVHGQEAGNYESMLGLKTAVCNMKTKKK
jgi:hypothetical protein